MYIMILRLFLKKSHDDKVQYLMTSGKHLDVTLEKINDEGDEAFQYVFDTTRFTYLGDDVNQSVEKIYISI